MDLPKSWSDITVELYAELQQVRAENFKGVTGMMVEVLSILSGEDVEVIEEMPTRRIKKLYDSVAFIQSPPRVRPAREFDLNGLQLRYKGMGLTLGEYIDLVGWNTGIVQAEYIAATLYRRVRLGDWGEDLFEPRVYDLEERATAFAAMPVSKVWGCVNDFRDFNTMIREKYGELFPSEEPEEDEGDEPKENRRTIGSQANEAKERARKLHQWQKLVHDLCGGDITKRSEVLKTPVIYVFNTMGMTHDLKES